MLKYVLVYVLLKSQGINMPFHKKAITKLKEATTEDKCHENKIESKISCENNKTFL